MLLRQGWERRGGARRQWRKKASRAGLASALISAPFWPPLPLCLSFPLIKSSWIGWV